MGDCGAGTGWQDRVLPASGQAHSRIVQAHRSLDIHVVILGTGRGCDLLCHRKQLLKTIIGNVGQLRAMMLRDHELRVEVSLMLCSTHYGEGTDSMSVAERVDVQESKGLLALKELHRGDLPYSTCGQNAPLMLDTCQRTYL